MLSIDKCKKILAQNGKKCNDEEVKRIRELLYKIGQFDYELFTTLKTKQDANSNHLHKGINR